MTKTTYIEWSSALGFFMPFAFCLVGSGLPNQDYFPHKTISFQKGPSPASHSGFATYPPGRVFYDNGVYVSYNFSPHVHEIVCIFGFLYRARGPVCELLKDSEVPKWLLRPTPGSFSIPCQRKDRCYGTFGWHVAFVSQIQIIDKKNSVATILLAHRDEVISMSADVKRGDYLILEVRRKFRPVEKYGWLVLDVVPPDKMTRVAGWVEFSPKAVLEKELVKKKISMVYPVEKKGNPNEKSATK